MWGRLKPLYISPYYDLGYINTCTNIQVSGSAGQNGRIVMDLALTVASWKYGWAADTEEEGGGQDLLSKAPVWITNCSNDNIARPHMNRLNLKTLYLNE